MTVPSYFTANRSSPSVGISGGPAPVTLRGSSLVPISSSSTFVPWPSGTVEGDVAVFLASSGWDFQGASISAFEQRLEYISGTGTPVSGWAFWMVVSASQITDGGLTLNSSSGAIFVSTFDGSENPSVSKVESLRLTPPTASQVLGLAGGGENDTFLVFGAIEANTTVDFTNSPETHQLTGSGYTATAGVYEPGSRIASETISYGATTGSSYSITVRVSRGVAGEGLTVGSTAISAASIGTRWAVGALYFEMIADVLTGTPSVGLINWIATFGAATLGGSNNAPCYQSNGQVRMNNATLATIMPFAQGDNISVAYHPGMKLIWFRVNGGSWNNSGTADPATFTEGIELTNFDQNRVSPAVGFSVTGGVFTAILADADFVYSPPAGYYSIEEVVVTTAMTLDEPFCPQPAGDSPADWFCRTELPEENHSRYISFPAGPVKVIAGEVQEEGVGVEGRLVRLYNRRTGELVGEVRTNGTGDFVIPAQDPTLEHFVVAFDDDITPDYNAKIYDNVIPQ